MEIRSFKYWWLWQHKKGAHEHGEWEMASGGQKKVLRLAKIKGLGI